MFACAELDRRVTHMQNLITDDRTYSDKHPRSNLAYTYVLPRLALAFAFKQKMPELTISYEDAAEVILDNLSKSGRFSRRRVGGRASARAAQL
jgi:hypothetical protein